MKFRVFSIVLAMVLISGPADAETVYKNLQKFLDENFTGEGFLPTPYGADDRFSPKTMWIRVGHAQNRPWKSGMQKAWIPLSDGRSIYPDDMVPLRIRDINTQSWTLGKDSKFALAAAIVGELESLDAELGLTAEMKRDMDIELSFGRVQIEYGFYWDYIQAQEVNAQLLGVMNQLLKSNFDGRIPDRRVITASLRVHDPVIVVKGTTGSSFGFSATVASILKKLGLEWDSEKEFYKSIRFDGWRYIGYQAMIADRESGKISTANETVSPVEYSTPSESRSMGNLAGLTVGD